MPIWLLIQTFFGGQKGAIVAIALGVVVIAAGGWLVANAFEIAALERDVAKAEKATAKAKEDLTVVTANRDGLKLTIEQQSASITQLQASNEALTREANLRAALLLANASRESAAIRAAPPTSAEDLNAWFRLQFQ